MTLLDAIQGKDSEKQHNGSASLDRLVNVIFVYLKF